MGGMPIHNSAGTDQSPATQRAADAKKLTKRTPPSNAGDTTAARHDRQWQEQEHVRRRRQRGGTRPRSCRCVTRTIGRRRESAGTLGLAQTTRKCKPWSCANKATAKRQLQQSQWADKLQRGRAANRAATSRTKQAPGRGAAEQREAREELGLVHDAVAACNVLSHEMPG
jgi:hypothetical protein